MRKHIYIISDDGITDIFNSFDFLPENNMNIDETFYIEEKKYNVLATLGDKGACSVIIKDNNGIIFSTIFDANRAGIPNVTLFFLISNNEYLQIGFDSH